MKHIINQLICSTAFTLGCSLLATPVLAAADNNGVISSTAYQAPTVAEQKAAVAASVSRSVRHGSETPLLYKIMIDRLERDFTDDGDFSYLDGQAWLGSSTNRLWLKGETGRKNGDNFDANLEAYYSRAIAAYWDAQIGVRHDFSESNAPGRNWLGFGFQGLAPYKFETGVTGYVGSSGRTAMRVRSEYNILITQRLVFWPEVELNLYGKDDPERNLGKGLADSRLALRLRYEIRREIAPYIGMQWTNKYSNTAEFSRQNGETVNDMQVVAGVRIWW